MKIQRWLAVALGAVVIGFSAVSYASCNSCGDDFYCGDTCNYCTRSCGYTMEVVYPMYTSCLAGSCGYDF